MILEVILSTDSVVEETLLCGMRLESTSNLFPLVVDAVLTDGICSVLPSDEHSVALIEKVL